jgi:hypothetical protein
VVSALARQNFLVIGGSETCPGDPSLEARLATVQHQP